MNANELMLGNYVEFNETIYKVLAIKSGFMQVAYESEKGNFIVSWIDNDSLNPIPLTEQWLLKVDWNGYVYLSINRYFKLDKEGRLYYHNDYTGINIITVNQLQNLYFVLTGNHLQLVIPK